MLPIIRKHVPMATTARDHIQKIFAAKLWLQPSLATSQFCTLFGMSHRRSSLFLEAREPATLRHRTGLRHVAHLNKPEVIEAYRACFRGEEPSPELLNLVDKPKRGSVPREKPVAKDISRLFQRAKSGRLEDVVSLRAKIGDLLRRQRPTSGAFAPAEKLDALLLQQLSEKFSYSREVSARLTRELATLRSREASMRANAK
ncbi:hypothetical protein [Caballeronia zhejiangensis]|uniref:Uncharacterized protein n=2 Tax=Burkholderiaceae TaxID=119060 RepID=A0A656QHT1_9BURK|nr:hypothetical protein [Caballeronia zhejiangensis]KAK43948.1 hypothetical protein BG58_28660 [Caballeronia jiangsuensis]KDR28880.1 hypothetical protein BG60_09090 [Caballeronia zhejiangensis]SAL58002.1 hypothetical protein AWB71_03172 [Caballeronia peredens]